MSVSLTPLERLAGAAPTLPGYVHGRAMAGHFGRLYWIVTQDDDGHTEASLSHPQRIHPTSSEAKAFFKMWGVKPESTGEKRKTCTHWLVKRGAEQ